MLLRRNVLEQQGGQEFAGFRRVQRKAGAVKLARENEEFEVSRK
jgi:hypothetical protein